MPQYIFQSITPVANHNVLPYISFQYSLFNKSMIYVLMKKAFFSIITLGNIR
ncbi:Uncharacterised protein [Bacillus tequilensis]|nr:Uncharacterised protein [Bacillus tequilensis]